MGCTQSHNLIQLKKSNAISNLNYADQGSQDNDKIYQQKKGFQNIDQKHPIASAFKNLENKQKAKAQQEQKKIISSLNRYYQQNKKKCQYVDSQSMRQFDYQFIIKILRRHHLFNQLFTLLNNEKDFLTKFLLSVKKRTFNFRDYIYKQHDPSSKFYIVAEGKMFIQLNSMGLKPLSRSDYFGLQSIIYNSQQGQSIKVKSSKAILYEIEREEIEKVRQKVTIKNKDQIKQLFQQKVLFFNFLDNKQKQKILSQTVKSTYSKGQIIFQKDYDANAFFVIKKGYVLIKIPQKKDLILQQGNSFGESSFYQHKGQRKGKAIAFQDNTIIYAIGSKTIFKSLGNKVDCAVLHNLQKWALYRDKTVNQLYFTYNFNMQKFILLFDVKKAQKYQILCRKDQLAERIFINLRSEINFGKDLAVFNTKVIKQLLIQYLKLKKQNKQKTKLDYDDFNQNFKKNDALDQNQKQTKGQILYEADLIVTQRGTYAQASAQKIFKFIVQSIQRPQQHKTKQSLIKLSVSNIQKYIKLKQSQQKTTLLAVQKHFGIEHIIKVFPKVKQNKKTQLFFKPTIKTKKQMQNSFKLQKQNRINKILQERRLVEGLNYPEICGFYKAEEDENNIYLIYEYIKGVTLLEVQTQLGIMPEILIQFYVLKIALILDYLHQKHVIYRDLKLQNILIDNKGAPNLFDFKTAKKLTQSQSFRTTTLIGTPYYISPETIQRKPYTFSSDYWQLGVLLYQLIYQKLPFADQSDDPMQIFSQILKKQPKLKKQNSCSVFKNLLNKCPQKRITGFNRLVKQKYFQNFQWEELKQHKMMPPYIPKNSSVYQEGGVLKVIIYGEYLSFKKSLP